MYKTDIYKIYTKCVWKASHISTNFCVDFLYKIKRTMAAKICKI